MGLSAPDVREDQSPRTVPRSPLCDPRAEFVPRAPEAFARPAEHMLTKRRFEGAVRGAQGAGLIGSVEVSAWVELFPRAVILTIATPARAGASHVW